ncbi:MAG TPA: hypothetical protein VGJ84_03645, partial [Polyangiaceae bacterium]
MRTRLWWSLVVLLGGTSCSSSNSNEPPQEPQPDALQAETDAAQPTTDTAQPTSDASQPTNAALQVHLVQASNDSLYAFVRAKFEPGEVVDPWAVRFFGSDGTEKPYFVWDSMTCKTARDGREDWDHRYAALNHHPGRAPEALQMRAQALEAANQQLPDLGAKLLAEDVAAQQAGDSVCNAMYLVRHTVPAFAKEKLTLQIYPTRQVEANVRTLNGTGDAQKT